MSILQRVSQASWRNWPRMLLRRLRGSLQLRSILLSGGLSIIAVVLITAFMSLAIGNALFDSRLNQALTESSRATDYAQQTISASTATDEVGLNNLVRLVRSNVLAQAPGSGGKVAILRTVDQDTSIILPDIYYNQGAGVISQELRSLVGSATDTQYYQSVSLAPDSAPAIIVGTQLDMGVAGQYELYLLFDLADAAEMLVFFQQTILISGLLLAVLIALVSWLVARVTITPIKTAAQTSRELASGDLSVRIPVTGEDEIAVLATSFNDMASSMQQQITRLAELSTLQQRFVSDVSHELRTPLTTIRLASDVIYGQRDEMKGSTKRAAELLQSQTQRFELLLDDLLEISRIDAGEVQMEHDPVNIVKLVEDVIESVQELAKQQGSEVRLVAMGGYLEAELDARRIRRVIRNLVDNAIEHGEARPIVITVDSNEASVAVAVRDYGIGMTEQAQSQVFNRFWRADPSRKRTIGGTGLGLAISMEDVQLHNGWLEVWSRPDVGSCFRLTLPVKFGAELQNSPLELPPKDNTIYAVRGDGESV